MKDLVSIIIPIYKVEAYLEECIVSVLNQTYKQMEIILVETESPDNCGEICDQLALKDKRVKVIHKENLGLSDARNAGLDIATGKYVSFIDSDDFVSVNMIEDMVALAVKEEANIVITNHYIFDKADHRHYNGPPKQMVMNSEDAIDLVYRCKYSSVFAWGKLYTKELFEDIKYPVGRLAEDAFVIVDLMDKAHKIVYDSTPYYHYRINSNSLSHRNFTSKTFDVVDAYEKNMAIIKEKYPKLIRISQYRYFWALNIVLGKMMSAGISKNSKEYIRVQRIFKKNCFRVFFLPVMPFTRKVLLLILAFFSNLFYKIETLRKNSNRKNKI